MSINTKGEEIDIKKEDGKITLEVGKLRDIKYEEMDKFRTSVSYEAYKEASAITKEIVEDNMQLQQKNKKAGSSGTEIRNLEQIYNIIFFTGDRGTGKTSVMLSYVEFLKDYYRKFASLRDEPGNKEFYMGQSEYMFTGLEYIDASTLDEKEDILGSVLSKMMKKWQDEERRSYGNSGIRRAEDYDYKKRQIYMWFSKVYENLKNVRSKSDIMQEDNDAFMETLQNLSLTWNLKCAFQELVMHFLDIMEYPGAERKIGRDNHFLVISIDDLDMNIKHGFQLLDQIRKYFMGPNIIVLLSANYEQLEKICNNHYMAELEKIKDFSDTKGYITRLSREYLEKIVPFQRQVVLQSGEKWKFFNGKQIVVKYQGGEKKIPGQEGTLKEIIREDMISYFGAGFMPEGKCLYYLTPDTLRELCTWIIRTRRLSALNDISEKDICEKNFQWFWNEEFPVLRKRYLDFYDDKIFETADLLEPDGQVRLIKESLIARGLLKEWQKEDSLLEIILMLNQGTMQEQALASLISIYFTVMFAEIRADMKWLEGEKRIQASQRFCQYFSDGMWGIWEERMVPLMSGDNDRDTLFYPIGYYTFKKIGEALNLSFQHGITGKKSFRGVEKFLEKNKEQLVNYQLLLLFYRLQGRGAMQTEDIWEIYDASQKLKATEELEGLFCLSNPFVNLADTLCLARKFIQALPSILCTGAELEEGEREKIALKVNEEISIFHEEMFESIIPLESVEFLIETGKRAQLYLADGRREGVGKHSVCIKIQKFFSVIQECLEKYDKEQAENYKQHPIIKKILQGEQDFLDMLYNSIRSSTVPTSPQWPEEWGE